MDSTANKVAIGKSTQRTKIHVTMGIEPFRKNRALPFSQMQTALEPRFSGRSETPELNHRATRPAAEVPTSGEAADELRDAINEHGVRSALEGDGRFCPAGFVSHAGDER